MEVGEAARARSRRIAAGLGLAAGAAVAIAVYRQEGLDLDPRVLRERIETWGWLAPALFVGAVAARPFLLVPSWPLMTAGGLLFGVVGGVVWGTVGFTLGALISFGIGRGLGRDAVASRLRGRAARIDAYITRRGPLWMALYTGLPITPLTPVHLSAGLSGIALPAFGLAVVAGLVPRTALFSIFGDSVARGDWARASAALGLVAVAAAIGIVLTRRLGARRPPADPHRGRASDPLEGRE